MTSLPPTPDTRTERTRLIVESIVDVLAVAGLILLAYGKSELASAVIPVVALIAGARVGSAARSSGGGGPSAGGAVAILGVLFPFARHVFAIVMFGALLSGCAGSNVTGSAAYATAIRAARYTCAVIATLPDPSPTDGDGGAP